jgi:tetratricopeptide (TPR) repeat protein
VRLLAGVIALGLAVPAVAADAARVTVSVLELRNASPLLDADWLADAVPELVSTQLARTPSITVLERQALGALQAERDLAGDGDPARGVEARWSIGGTFQAQGDRLDIALTIAEPGAAKPAWSKQVSGAAADYAALSRQLAVAAAAFLAPDGAHAATAVDSRAAGPPPQAAPAYYRGLRELEQARYERALAEFLRAARAAPEYAEAWRRLGQTLEALGRLPTAVAAYEQAIAADPDDPACPATLWQLGRALETTAPADATKLYRRLIDEYPFARVSHIPSQDETYADRARLRLESLAGAAPTTAAGSKTPATSAPTVPTAPSSPAPTAPPANDAFAAAVRVAAARLARLDQDGSDQTTVALHRSIVLLVGAAADPMIPRLDDRAPLRIDQKAGRGDVGTMVAPPPGKAFEAIRVTVEPAAGGRPLVGGFGGERQKLAADELPVPPAWACGAWVELSAGSFKAGDPPRRWTLTPRLRDRRPGTLVVTSSPPHCAVLIDGAERGITPCRLGDLAPGDHRVEIRFQYHGEDYLDTGLENTEESTFVDFAASGTVAVAATGETRLDAVLAHHPGSPLPGWGPLRLAVPAPIALDGGADDHDADDIRPHAPVLGALPRGGWAVADTADGDLWLASSPDGRAWTKSRRLPAEINTTEPETALALVSSAGTKRTVLVFSRGDALFASASEDLEHWSPARRLLAPADREKPKFLGAAANGVGTACVAAKLGGRQLLITSPDGGEWKAPVALVFDAAAGDSAGVEASSLVDEPGVGFCSLRVVRSGDRPVLARHALTPDGHQRPLAPSPPLPQWPGNGLRLVALASGRIEGLGESATCGWEPPAATSGEALARPFPIADRALAASGDEAMLVLAVQGSLWVSRRGDTEPAKADWNVQGAAGAKP